MTERDLPALDEVRGWLTSLSTWGRWGAEDDLGTLNYIGPDERAAALRLATGSATLSCALPITFERQPHASVGPADPGVPHPSWARPHRFVIDVAHGDDDHATRSVTYDAFLIAPHGPHVTHLDAPRHTVVDGTSYNGLPAGSNGARGTIERLRDGVVGRGVLLDVPRAQGRSWLDDGEAIHPTDLEACERDAGVRVGRGDVLFVRTGYRRRMPGGPPSRHAARPGLHASCIPWLSEREVALIGADVAVDVIPHGYPELGLPIHTVGMWAMGLWLLDNCALEDLAEACNRAGRWAFLAVIAPLILQDGSGSPVNPLAVF